MSQSDQLPEDRNVEHSPGIRSDQNDKVARFKKENAAVFSSLNAWVEENGLPLARYRPF